MVTIAEFNKLVEQPTTPEERTLSHQLSMSCKHIEDMSFPELVAFMKEEGGNICYLFPDMTDEQWDNVFKKYLSDY